jgi:hypothetical protein
MNMHKMNNLKHDIILGYDYLKKANTFIDWKNLSAPVINGIEKKSGSEEKIELLEESKGYEEIF